MPKKSSANSYEETLELYEKLVALFPEVERKGATMPYTSLNGHMFSFLTKGGQVALRLPDSQREAFLKKYKTQLCEQYGTVMKEYAVVPASLLKKTKELQPYFAASLEYIGSLKPKPTTRKKKASKKTTAKRTTVKKSVAKKSAKKKAVKKKSRKKK